MAASCEKNLPPAPVVVSNRFSYLGSNKGNVELLATLLQNICAQTPLWVEGGGQAERGGSGGKDSEEDEVWVIQRTAHRLS